MLAVLSPAKRLDFERAAQTPDVTQPALLDQTRALVRQLRGYTPDDLQQLMKISPALAELNAERFRDFKTPLTARNARPAAVAFAGDTYAGLQAESFTEANWRHAQQHVAILSGLFGVLRPLDLIQPYRLEMGTKLETKRGADLYAFWGDRVTETLNTLLADHSDPTVVNLASQEYFKAVRPATLTGPVITPQFKERRGDGLKTIGLMAKRARGAMARYLVKKRLKRPEALKRFDLDGYAFDASLSSSTEWVFVR